MTKYLTSCEPGCSCRGAEIPKKIKRPAYDVELCHQMGIVPFTPGVQEKRLSVLAAAFYCAIFDVCAATLLVLVCGL